MTELHKWIIAMNFVTQIKFNEHLKDRHKQCYALLNKQISYNTTDQTPYQTFSRRTFLLQQVNGL